jgi:hypothetical protein
MTAMHATAIHPAQIKGNCCAEAAALPCGLKKSRAFELPMCALSNARAEFNGSAFTAAILKDSFPGNIGIEHKHVWFSGDTFLQSSPIYLQHLSLLI